MLRIHLSGRDWQNLRVVSRPEPMWELVLSLYMLGEASDELVFGQWRQRVLARLPGNTRHLLSLIPPQGYSPDFLSPLCGNRGLADGIEEVLSTPRRRISGELDLRYGPGPRPAWAERLSRKEPSAMQALDRSLTTYFDIALRPYWNYIAQVVERSAASSRDGENELMALIGSSCQRPPVRNDAPTTVEIDYGVDQDLHLGGRGLLLVPAFFCATNPVTFLDPSLPPVLMYPVGHPPVSFLAKAATGTEPSPEVLGRLFGHTRAAVLRALNTRHTTGELARSLNISPSSASEHATLLRAAGLVSSERDGTSVQHHLTPFGLELLHPAP